MVGWIIFGSIALFLILLFVLLFTVHANLIIDMKDEMALTVKVLGIPIRILPKKQKKYNLKHYTLKKIRKREAKEAKKQAKAARKKAEKAAEKAKKKAAEQKLTKAQKKALKKRKKAAQPAITDLVPLAGQTAKLFFSHFFGKLHIQMARIHIKVGGGDAAMVAISYGVITNAVGGLVKLLQTICDVDSLKKADIVVEPDFTSNKIEFDCHVTFRMSLGNVVWAAIKAGWHFLFGFIKIKPDVPDEPKPEKKKSVKKHDDTPDAPEAPDAPETSSELFGIPLPPKPPRPW